MAVETVSNTNLIKIFEGTAKLRQDEHWSKWELNVKHAFFGQSHVSPVFPFPGSNFGLKVDMEPTKNKHGFYIVGPKNFTEFLREANVFIEFHLFHGNDKQPEILKYDWPSGQPDWGVPLICRGDLAKSEYSLKIVVLADKPYRNGMDVCV